MYSLRLRGWLIYKCWTNYSCEIYTNLSVKCGKLTVKMTPVCCWGDRWTVGGYPRLGECPCEVLSNNKICFQHLWTFLWSLFVRLSLVCLYYDIFTSFTVPYHKLHVLMNKYKIMDKISYRNACVKSCCCYWCEIDLHILTISIIVSAMKSPHPPTTT